MKLADIQTGSIQEMPTPRGVAWTAELKLKVNGKVIATAHHEGRGGCVDYVPTTMTRKEWQPILEALEAEAREALDHEFGDLDLLMSFAKPNQLLTDAVKTYHLYMEEYHA